MNMFLAIAAVALSLAPGLAIAGEGDGPDFPGLQIPNITVGSSMQPGSGGVVRETISHRSDGGLEPANSFPSAVTPGGIVRPGQLKTRALNRNVTAMAGTPQH